MGPFPPVLWAGPSLLAPNTFGLFGAHVWMLESAVRNYLLSPGSHGRPTCIKIFVFALNINPPHKGLKVDRTSGFLPHLTLWTTHLSPREWYTVQLLECNTSRGNNIQHINSDFNTMFNSHNKLERIGCDTCLTINTNRETLNPIGLHYSTRDTQPKTFVLQFTEHCL